MPEKIHRFERLIYFPFPHELAIGAVILHLPLKISVKKKSCAALSKALGPLE